MTKLVLSLAILLSAPTVASTMDWSDLQSGISAVASTLVVDNPFITQQPEINAPAEVIGRSDFHSGIIAAAVRARQAGTITARDSLKIRVAMLSPAFRQSAKQLCLTQMAFSGSDQVPVDANGIIDETAVDWSGLADFLTAILPILLQLLELFGI